MVVKTGKRKKKTWTMDERTRFLQTDTQNKTDSEKLKEHNCKSEALNWALNSPDYDQIQLLWDVSKVRLTFSCKPKRKWFWHVGPGTAEPPQRSERASWQMWAHLAADRRKNNLSQLVIISRRSRKVLWVKKVVHPCFFIYFLPKFI